MARPPPALEAVAGLLAGFLLEQAAGGPFAAGALALGAWLLPRLRPARVASLALAAGCLAAGAARSAPADDAFSAALPEEAVRCLVEGTVLEADPPGRRGLEATVEVVAWSGEDGRRTGRGRVRATVEGPPPSLPDLHPGDAVVLAGRASRVPAPTNPGVLDLRSLWARRGVHARLEVPDARGVERVRPSDGPLAAVSRARRASAAALDAAFPAADAGLLRSLLLGDRGALDPADRERFRAAGAAHVLAISGAHVALLVAGLWAALRRLGVGPRPAAALVLAGTILFVPFTGSAAPVVRSAAGSALFLVGRLLGREPSGGLLLAAVATGCLLLDPASAADPGFRMSFAAATGLIALTPRLRAALVRPREVRLPGMRASPRAPVRSALAAGLAAWVGSTPFAALDLGQAGTVAVPVGLVAVPLSTMGMLLGAAGAALAPLPLLGPAACAAARGVLAALRAALDAPVALGWAQVGVARPSGGWLFAYAAAAFVLARARPAAAAGAACVLAACLAALHDDAPAPPPAEPRLTLLDVGHGQAALLETPDGRRALLDAGSRDRPEVARRILRPALRALGVTVLDLVVVSHADGDHAGAVEEVLREVPADAFVVPPRFPEALLARWSRRGEPVLRAREGDVLLAGAWGRVAVLGPGRNPTDDPNEGGLVVAIETAGGRLLLPGDRTGTGVDDLLASGAPCRAEVLVLPHHGLPSPKRDALRAAARARWEVASAPRSALSLLPPTALATGGQGALVLRVDSDRIDLDAPWSPPKRASGGYPPAPPMPDLSSLALAAGVLLLVAGASIRLGWLTPPGAAGAALLGFAAVYALGWAGLAGLLAPFVAGTLAGRLPGGKGSEGPRTLRQVAANGLPAVLGLALAWAGSRAAGAAAFAGSLSALGADTLATEVGVRWGGTPRHAVTGRPLASGESGGVTLLGLAASAAGSLLAPAALWAAGGLPGGAVAACAAAGVAAAYADSVLGAVLQRKGRCPVCGATAETREHCGAPVRRARGRLAWLDNDGVNLVNGFVGAAVALALAASGAAP